MTRTRAFLIACAVAVASLGVVHAQYGTPPAAQSGQQLIDGTWLLGLAGGGNHNYRGAITATAGGTQAAAFQLPANVALFSVDTVATSGDSVKMPFCVAGQMFTLANTSANTLYIFANNNTNRATNSTDTINDIANATEYQLATDTSALFFCAVNGKWKAIKSA